jgi:hypothetical protein
MTIEVEKEDIRKIGNVWSNEDGFLAIICNSDTANIEEILLRNVLKCFGEEYHIVRSEDFIWQDDEGDGDDVYEIEFITNLPIEKFDEISSR